MPSMRGGAVAVAHHLTSSLTKLQWIATNSSNAAALLSPGLGFTPSSSLVIANKTPNKGIWFQREPQAWVLSAPRTLP
jgi:hypothetical protein